MEISELKALAQERGLSAIKKRENGPVTVMKSATGEFIGSFPNTEAAVKAIEAFPVVPPLVVVPSEWSTHSQATPDPVRCPNGYGPECLCLDKTFIYLCAVNICPNKAECLGTCRGHFSQLRVFGDLTKAALKKTDLYHSEGLILQVFPAVLPLKMIRPTGKDWTTLTPAELHQATDGVIGMTVRFTGTEYVLLDKDGHVLDRVTSKTDLM